MRVLVYRALGLGDFLTAVPAYRAVRRSLPSYEVVLAAPEPLRPLVPLVGALDALLPTAPSASPAWSGEPPDVAVNLHGRGPQSHVAVLALQPRRLVAFARPELGVDGPRWRADEHEVARWCRLVAAAGMPADPGDLRLAAPGLPPPRSQATVVHPGAADPARRWPADRFAAVAAALSAEGHDVVVTGVAGEGELARSVAHGAGLADDAVLAGRLDLGQLAALVAAARLVVCGDTGVAHLASAYGIPSVALFGPMSPALWGPPPDRPQHQVLWRPELAGVDGAAGGPHPSLLAIGVDEVLDRTCHAVTAAAG